MRPLQLKSYFPWLPWHWWRVINNAEFQKTFGRLQLLHTVLWLIAHSSRIIHSFSIAHFYNWTQFYKPMLKWKFISGPPVQFSNKKKRHISRSKSSRSKGGNIQIGNWKQYCLRADQGQRHMSSQVLIQSNFWNCAPNLLALNMLWSNSFFFLRFPMWRIRYELIKRMIVKLGFCSRRKSDILCILAWVIWDKTNNEDIEDSNEECEDYGCVVQLCWLLHVVLHVDVQSSLRNEEKTNKDLKKSKSGKKSPLHCLHTTINCHITWRIMLMLIRMIRVVK